MIIASRPEQQCQLAEENGGSDPPLRIRTGFVGGADVPVQNSKPRNPSCRSYFVTMTYASQNPQQRSHLHALEDGPDCRPWLVLSVTADGLVVQKQSLDHRKGSRGGPGCSERVSKWFLRRPAPNLPPLAASQVFQIAACLQITGWRPMLVLACDA